MLNIHRRRQASDIESDIFEFVMATLPGSINNLVQSKTLKWIFVGGKGGVGKTTTSCSLAVALAATRKSVLLVSIDPAHNLSDAFGQKFSNQPTLVNSFDNLHAMEVEPPQGNSSSNSNSNTNSTNAVSSGDNRTSTDPSNNMSEFASEMLDEFGSTLPGIDEAMAFGTLMKSVREMDHDIVVFDTAPTGHTMRLLGFPSLLEKALSVFQSLVSQFGPMASTVASTLGTQAIDIHSMIQRIESMRDVTKEVSEVFSDSSKCTFVCVCIPEFLSVFETERLVQEVAKFDISVTNIIVNQVIRDLDIKDQNRGEQLYRARVAMQTKYLEQVVELYGEDFHITAMPLLTGEVRGREALDKFSHLLIEEKKEFTVGMEGMNEIGEYEGSLKNVIEDDNIHWVFVGGKGGVGKTTTSSSVGVSFERKGFKTLLVSTDPAHNLSDAFGQKISSGTEPTKINGYSTLYAMEVNATEAAEEFIMRISADNPQMGGGAGGGGDGGAGGEGRDEAGVAAMISKLLPPDTLRQLVASIPGIDEAVSFMQIVKLAKSMRFDRIVFDTAPTGHTLRLLGFPRVVDKALERVDGLRQKVGPMLSMMSGGDANTQRVLQRVEEELDKWKKGLVEVTNILNDQERTTFVCVAIAEFLSVYETERLVQQLCELNVNVRNILVNQLMSPKETEVFAALQTRSKMQRKYLEQVDELYPPEDFHITYMPLLPAEIRGIDALKEYGDLATSGGADITRSSPA